jgi:hypothetical protein
MSEAFSAHIFKPVDNLLENESGHLNRELLVFNEILEKFTAISILKDYV